VLVGHRDWVYVGFPAACAVSVFSPQEAWTVPYLYEICMCRPFDMWWAHIGQGLEGIGPCVPHERLRRELLARVPREPDTPGP